MIPKCNGTNIIVSSSSYAWNTRLCALSDAGRHQDALAHYILMLRHATPPPPDTLTLPAALRSITALSLTSAAAQLHARALRSGSLPSDPFVLTSLLSSYSRLSLLSLSLRLFHDITSNTSGLPASTLVVCYNAIISAHAHHSVDPFPLFLSMRRNAIPFTPITMLSVLPSSSPLSLPLLHASVIKSGVANDSISNCLITAYAKLGAVDVARQVFDELPVWKELITWNAMISAYSQNGLAPQVLDLYRQMSCSIRPDAVTLVGVLSSCASLGAGAVGRDIDRYISDDPLLCSNIYLKNALINMHARCANLERAHEIFDMMVERSIVSWTAIIAGYGMHGHGCKAMQLFETMLAAGVRPDGVVMVSVLSACSHAGLTEEGMKYFFDMQKVHGLKPKPEHYACVVDLLGRAGRLEDAMQLIASMPVQPDGATWGALLGACKIHKNVALGELAFAHVVQLEPTNVGYYVLLSNIYTDAGMEDGVTRVRAMMRRRGLRKDPGYSYVEHKGKVHLFMADDHSHHQAKGIYEMINKLEALLKKKDKKEEEGNAMAIGYHSEKLAIAFGLLNTEVGVEILVIKNLRVCGDCHAFIKAVSEVADRRVVVRDATRFHHFQGGVCSCNDYW